MLADNNSSGKLDPNISRLSATRPMLLTKKSVRLEGHTSVQSMGREEGGGWGDGETYFSLSLSHSLLSYA